MATETLTGVHISLDAACDFAGCARFAFPLHKQLKVGYELCSVLRVPVSVGAWREAHRTARKRADRAERLGFRFAEIRREEFDEDIAEINLSLPERQGRPMAPAYRERNHYLPLPEYPCRRHAIRTFGVLSGARLVAYLWLYRAGDLGLVSSILGHGDHLDSGIMFLLVQGVVEAERPNGGYLVYNRADSGTDGLRWFKERCGFEPMEVAWEL